MLETIMGSAHYIVLETTIDGLDTKMDGKRLSQHIDTLDKTARKLGVHPLSEFFSMPPEDLADRAVASEFEPVVCLEAPDEQGSPGSVQRRSFRRHHYDHGIGFESADRRHVRCAKFCAAGFPQLRIELHIRRHLLE